jgi:hypothetical protein
MKHGFNLVCTSTTKTAQHGLLEISAPSRTMMWCLSTENNCPIFFRETAIPENYHVLIMNFKFLFKVDEQRMLDFTKLGSGQIQQIQKRKLYANFLVVALLLKICGPLDLWI